MTGRDDSRSWSLTMSASVTLSALIESSDGDLREYREQVRDVWLDNDSELLRARINLIDAILDERKQQRKAGLA